MDVMKARFNEKLLSLLENKKENSGLLTREKYLHLIDKIRESKSKISGKKPEDYQRLKRYDIMKVGDDEKLIYPVNDGTLTIRYYVQTEEIFDLINTTHLAIGHGGRTRMLKELQKKYKNITCEEIMIYLRLCEICKKKSKIPRKGLVVRPMIFNEMNSRCQIDLIDMRSQPDNDYKFIFVYQDHLTKFVQLRPLKSKRTKEVAHVLLDIFATFGAPSVLQSDNGREFCNRVIEEACSMWEELKIVHGEPSHSQSQGSVERTNQDIEKMLSSWLETNQTTHWTDGLRFVQIMKNRAYHEGIKCSPYEAMFGAPIKLGLKTSSLPDNAIQNVQTEEELEKLIESSLGNSGTLEATQAKNDEENLSENRDCTANNDWDMCSIKRKKEGVIKMREGAKIALQNRAKKMKQTSDSKFLKGYDWLCDDTMGGGILALVGSHVIDLIFHLMGQRASRVHAVVRTFTQTTKYINGIRHVTSPDFCSFQMELSGGTLVTATLSNHLQGQLSQEVLICGGGNHLVVRGGDLYGCRGEHEEILYRDTDDLQGMSLPIADSIPRPYIKGLRKMIAALREAFQSVEDKRGWIKEPVFSASTFEDGLYVQAVIDALRQSNKQRGWAKVNILTEEPDPNPLLSAAVRATAISI